MVPPGTTRILRIRSARMGGLWDPEGTDPRDPYILVRIGSLGTYPAQNGRSVPEWPGMPLLGGLWDPDDRSYPIGMVPSVVSRAGHGASVYDLSHGRTHRTPKGDRYRGYRLPAGRPPRGGLPTDGPIGYESYRIRPAL